MLQSEGASIFTAQFAMVDENYCHANNDLAVRSMKYHVVVDGALLMT